MNKPCDIVLPVFNGLTYVKDCVDSILKYTEKELYNLFIVDDGSDQFTVGYLKDIQKAHPSINLSLNTENIGFLKTCNKGMRLGDSRHVLLLNTDVIVTPGWLTRLLECAEKDPLIASVNPFTNNASEIEIPLPQGANFYLMDRTLEEKYEGTAVDVVTGVGFCMLLRRSALEEVGYFDEIYDKGYCEESDLCMRLVKNGYRTVIADNVFVHHKGRSSFVDSQERYIQNRKIFDSRWETEYTRQYKAFLKKGEVAGYRRFFEKFDLPKTKTAAWTFFILKCRRALSRTPLKKAVIWVRKTTKTPDFLAEHNMEAEKEHLIEGFKGQGSFPRQEENGAPFNILAGKGRPSINFVFYDISLCGGVMAVVQLANELILNGYDARISTIKYSGGLDNINVLTQPIVFGTLERMKKYYPKSDIDVATIWATSYWVNYFSRRNNSRAIYYLQDYEKWFYEGQETKAWVEETYSLIENKVVTSSWLKGMLGKDGYDSFKINVGIDLGVFYPRLKGDEKRKNTVIAMARPSTPWRGFDALIKTMTVLKRNMPEIDIWFFGEDLSGFNIPFEYRSLGHISNRDVLSRYYSQATVFFDSSNFQGFGLPALEAMACATPCVLTNVGGVNEYAVDKENCLLVPPRDPEAASDAIASILKDSDLGIGISEAGQKMAKEFCHKKKGMEFKNYLEKLL